MARAAVAALAATALAPVALARASTRTPVGTPLAAPNRPSVSAPVIDALISSTPISAPLARGFLGLSLEYQALPAYAGHDPAHLDPVFLALVRALDPGQSPVLRIGGDSTDQTWWPQPGVLAPLGIRYALTPAWLRVAGAVAARLSAQMILGVNLAADDPGLAALEARNLIAGIGSQFIDALEIGNEPDLYTVLPWYRSRGVSVFARPQPYAMPEYLSEFARWRGALPAVPIAGPALAGLPWLSQLPSFLSAASPISIVTFHRYPLRACEHDPFAADYPTIANLLLDSSSSGLAAQVAQAVTTAHATGAQFRLDELNSAACKGKVGVSDTFASALWALDTLFNLARVGVDGVNFHTLPGSAYQPFSFTESRGAWSGYVHPLYYGLLAFARAFPAGARLLRVSLFSPSGPVKIYATQAAGGQLHVVVINKSPTYPALLHIAIPGTQLPLNVEPLLAPSLASTRGVTLGGASFGAATRTGVLPGGLAQRIRASGRGYYAVPVPAGSAVLLSG